ncbi:MAG: PSD1 domain-containing protein [Planctomyces sp.]|nr:PSD1 domain-containing protein [Planctomyces sp.]
MAKCAARVANPVEGDCVTYPPQEIAKLLFATVRLTVLFAGFFGVPALGTPTLTPVLMADSEEFENGPARLLIRRCLECHQGSQPSGGLSLSSREGLLKGGDSGAVLGGDSGGGLLVERVKSGEMPPPLRGVSQKLSPEEAQVLQSWIEAGAPWPKGRVLDLYEATTDVRGGRDWWSFQPIARPEVPSVRHPSGSQNPIDAFIYSQLKTEGMEPAPEADSRTLLRRLHADVTGLPPTAAALDEFAANASMVRYEQLVDELLAQPQFGERWARHWLDVVRYAETSGYERDQPKPHAWKYRDWVVNAMNSDLPYNEFVRQQLAGDELPDRTEQTVIATGFLRLGTWNDEPNDPEDYQYERLEDLVHVTSSAFLGLTVKCARCHDHKFDPIPQTDYYHMAASFWAGPIGTRGRDLLGGPSAEELGYSEVLGWTDISREPPPLFLLKNGDRHRPLDEVQPATLSLVPGQYSKFTSIPTDTPGTTGRRRQLADWIASDQNPLTARVIVNRLWLHHFGQALVRSPDNFGYTGEKPTHPELLDYLASELIRGGWKLKPLHRLILTSATWRQSSLHPLAEEYNRKDAANRWWWRANRRRLDAESLRDAFLASSGEIDLRVGGPSFYPTISADALEGLSRKSGAWTASPEKEQRRRSLYIFTQRSLLSPMMTTFDMSDTTLPCGQRDVTIVAPQALTLLNNEFVHQRSENLAEAIVQRTSDPRDRIIQIWRSILLRDPVDEELQIAEQHVNRQLKRFKDLRESSNQSGDLSPAVKVSIPSDMVLHLNASEGVSTSDDGRVTRWVDGSGQGHDAVSVEIQQSPQFVSDAIHGRPAIRFGGRPQFMRITGPVLSSDEMSVFAVVTDRSSAGHREIVSNWSGNDGNSGSSVFVGMTGESAVRFSDAVSGVGEIRDRTSPFLLTAVNGPHGVSLFQQNTSVYSSTQRLPERRLDTPWVLGQQGNIDGEYWVGEIAELIVYNRELSDDERKAVTASLMERYQLPELSGPAAIVRTPEIQAWASLCLVLLNSNEFAYID